MAKPLYDIGDTVLIPCKIDKIVITDDGVRYRLSVPEYNFFEPYSLTGQANMIIAQEDITNNMLGVITEEIQSEIENYCYNDVIATEEAFKNGGLK